MSIILNMPVNVTRQVNAAHQTGTNVDDELFACSRVVAITAFIYTYMHILNDEFCNQK